METKSQQTTAIPPLTAEQERAYIEWQDRLGSLWRASGFVAQMPGGVREPAKQRCFLDGLEPAVALARLIREDAEAFQARQEAIKRGAATLSGLSRTRLSRFIIWSTSRQNEYRKADVVNMAFETLALAKPACVFTTGSYSQSSWCGGWSYLINGQQGYIARGTGRDIHTFQEAERLSFPRKPHSEKGASS